jgi:hypothetical protein
MVTANYALAHYKELDAQGVPHGLTTHGKCTAYTTNWSDKTHECVKALLESMENDLLPRHFDNPTKEETNEGLELGGAKEPEQV